MPARLQLPARPVITCRQPSSRSRRRSSGLEWSRRRSLTCNDNVNILLGMSITKPHQVRKQAAIMEGHSIFGETARDTSHVLLRRRRCAKKPITSRKDIFIAGGFGARAAGHLLAYKYREGHQQADLSSVEFELSNLTNYHLPKQTWVANGEANTQPRSTT